tara:strand:+ start:4145 stop:5182 length:1038 start_codon:yes stop_codon:yes gene_type:complete
MIKIKLYEPDVHRNECTFRPYIWARSVLEEIGIQFTTGDSYDYAWVAQSSICNKKVSLQESVDTGLDFISKITGDYMILDGQDSTSIMGIYEVFKQSNATLLLKNCLFKDRSLYKQGWQLGRYYWGPGDYKLADFDKYSDRIVLSGTNWLSTHWAGINIQWQSIERPRQYDVSAMFQYPSATISYEHGMPQSKYYDEHRKLGIDALNNLEHDQFVNIAKLEDGVRISQQEYYQRMFDSKIIFAPFGYGAVATRDLEAALYGSVLLKPDVSFVETSPNVYEDGETYIACKHDFSDLNEKVMQILGNSEKYLYIIENARKKFNEVMQPHHIAMHLYNIFKNLKGVTT